MFQFYMDGSSAGFAVLHFNGYDIDGDNVEIISRPCSPQALKAFPRVKGMRLRSEQQLSSSGDRDPACAPALGRDAH